MHGYGVFFLELPIFVIVYDIWLGSAKQLAVQAGGSVLKAHKALCWFGFGRMGNLSIRIYWLGTPGWYSGLFGGLDMDVIYNIGDAINKIGFGLVVL